MCFHCQRIQPKRILDELEVNRDKVMIDSVDTINVFSSIKLSTIKKSVRYFSRKFTAATKKNTNLCLELIRFGMRSTIISFDGESYEYHGGKKEEQGL